MKNVFLVCSLFFSLLVVAQHNYDNQNTIYSHGNNIVTIGNNSVLGNFDDISNVLQLTGPEGGFLTIGETDNPTNVINIGATRFGTSLYFSNKGVFRFFAGGNILDIYGGSIGGGSVSIGTDLNPAGYKLAVGGKIIAEELRVQLTSVWPDYVFGLDYKLPTLQEVEKHIKDKGHLANIPSAKEVKENGIAVGEMNKLLLEKVEELTLYTIDQQKQLDTQTKEMEELKAMVKTLAEKNK